jgi:hypothetical protein
LTTTLATELVVNVLPCEYASTEAFLKTKGPTPYPLLIAHQDVAPTLVTKFWTMVWAAAVHVPYQMM